MNNSRRSVSGATSLSVGRKSGSNSHSASQRTSSAIKDDGADGGSGMIVTRGLQEILEQDRKFRHPDPPVTATGGASKSSGKKGHRASGQAPSFLICYLCGRQFGSASIDIHRPQCYLKKMIEWERGNPAIRGPKPLSPEEHEQMMKKRAAAMAGDGGGGGAMCAGGRGGGGASYAGGGMGGRGKLNEVDMYNQMQMEAFNETALVPCPNCGRTFLPDRLQVHLRSCKPGAVARPVRRPVSSITRAAASSNGTDAGSPATAPAGSSTSRGGSIGVGGAAAGAPRDPQEQPIRAAGAYHIPEGAGKDDVPPMPSSAARPPGPHAAAKRKAPPGTAAAAVVATVRVMDSDEDSDEIPVEEPNPVSPSADAERRLSSGGIPSEDVEMAGASAPGEPAVMVPNTEPRGSFSKAHDTAKVASAVTKGATEHDGMKEQHPVLASSFHSQSRGKDHAAGSRPRRFSSASAPRTAPVPLTVEVSMDAEEDEDEQHEYAAKSVASTNAALPKPVRVVECDSDLNDPYTSGSGQSRGRTTGSGQDNRFSNVGGAPVSGETTEGTPKKIPLNNVSHFKNVESRLHLQREAASATLVPCKFCGRTFVPERVQKHEDCCVERNKKKASVSRNSTGSARPSSAPATQKPQKSSPRTSFNATRTSPPNAVGSSLSGGKPKFCGGCGVHLSPDNRKFCTECGFKL